MVGTVVAQVKFLCNSELRTIVRWVKHKRRSAA